MHTLHEWAQGLAKRGLVSIAICNGGPNAVIPYNGSRGIMGTNPMAFGIPGENGEIHCVDMATSEVPYFEILNAYKNKTQLKEGLAVDFEGNPTTDPEKALDFSESETDPVSNLLSIGGGYKGYYITYLFEIMTSALIGALSGPEMSPDYVAEEHGCVLIVFNPKALGTEHSFIKTVKALHSAIRTQTPKAGTKMVVPGDGNNEKYNQFDGDLEISDELWDKLRTI